MNPGEVAALILAIIGAGIALSAMFLSWRVGRPAALALKCLRCGCTYHVTPDADRTCPACAAARELQ